MEPPKAGVQAPERVPLPAAPAGYEILGELGLGGMGAVYLAREVVPDRLVAIKFLRRPGSQSAYDRFLVEVRALAALDHPNIIRVLATDFFRSDPFFTTEYFPNGSLLKKVEESGALDPLEAARLMAVAARAVHAANQKDVIHRDLKPSNILLTADGVPKVADFGLAKRLDQDDDLTTSTGALGSPPYMAPEQTGKQGFEGVDARTDVYGLGATLYHLVTGHRPFVGDTPDEVMSRVLIDPPPPPRSLRLEVPRALEAIILKCLEKEPSRRYPSGEALAADLDRFVAGQQPEAPLLTWPRRAEQWARRHKKRITMTAGLVLGIAALLAIAIVILRPVTPEDPAEEIRKRLRAGESVTLIGQTGLPRYHLWQLGGGEFGACPTGEKTCYFESVGHGLLELVPDPGIDRYRLVLDIRHVSAAGGRPVGPDRSYVGPYLAQAVSPTVDGRPVHTFFAATFADIHSNGAPAGVAAAQTSNVVRFRSVAVSLRQNRDPGLHQRVILPPLPFAQSANLAGEWRTFRIDVTPEGVTIDWKNPDGAFVSLCKIQGEAIRDHYAELESDMNRDEAGSGVVVPPWSPRMPLGIWSFRAGVSLRNVVISPL
jgi:serine/threonine-protein kinase